MTIRFIYGVIYLITNLVNGKQYIGQTTASDPLDRWNAHIYCARRGDRRPVYYAIRKYGIENFRFEVIWYCIDQSSLDMSEVILSNIFGTLSPSGYNLKIGRANGKHASQTKAKIKASNSTPEARLAKSLRAIQMHSDIIFKKFHGKRISESLLRPGMHEKLSIQGKEIQSRPLVIKRRVELWSDPEFLQVHRQATINAMARPEIHDKLVSNGLEIQSRPKIIALLANPEYQEKHRAATRAGILQSEPLAKISRATKGTRYVNDGTNNIRLKFGLPIPEGWKLGRCCFLAGRWINNGKNNKLLRKYETVPDGWFLGMIIHNPTVGKHAINNGKISRWLKKGSSLPEGWSYGFIRKMP